MKNSGFYITTPIYYANGTPHIGHAFTTLLADSIARYKRIKGVPTRFTTGTDEHGQKVQEVAAQHGRSPQAQADAISEIFLEAWKLLDIKYDDFIRTTENRHKNVVKRLVEELIEKGIVYKGIYRGWYLISDEDFYPDSRVREISEDPENDPRLQRVEEENYFFKLSEFAIPLLEHYSKHPNFVLPRNRRKEMISMLEQGLEDLSISRASVDWGIPVPGNPNQVIYVWVEALMNYLTSSGIFQDEERYNLYWPAACQIVGKDILKFHAIIWPAILLALDLPLPKTILAHGWILVDGQKMSKSKGNSQDPMELSRKYGNDALRYTLLREISLGQDGTFDESVLTKRYNSELANDLGNLVQRTLGFASKKLQGTLPGISTISTDGHIFFDSLKSELNQYTRLMDEFKVSQALDHLHSYLQLCNRFVDTQKPWELAKKNLELFALFNRYIAEAVRVFAIASSPFLPDSANRILTILNQEPINEQTKWDMTILPNKLSPIPIGEVKPLFPKIKTVDETTKSTNINTVNRKAKGSLITIDDFKKVKLELVTIQAAKPHPDAEKLLILELSTSVGRKQVVSGIANDYECNKLIGMQVVFVKNLEPVELRGVLSEGMILAASNKKELSLVSVEHKIQEGSKVS